MNSRRLPLTPLAAALATIWPLISLAGTLPKPPSNAVPVPSASWRVYGNGGAAPINKPNGGGGVDQTISQTSSRGIYQWGSFDIGDKSSVTFDMAVKGASALNRIGGAAPSRIFGKLSATNGGEIFLINGNGILFGQGAVVDTGSLVASALNISDSEYLSGFAQSLANRTNPDLNAAFRYDGAPEDFIDSKNFVQVDPGATLRTASGGRIFLFAKRVENGGTLETPSGQTVLAAGGEIYLKLPESETLLYASETNPAISAVRGFLVEVGAGPADAPEGSGGRASNLATGVISTPRGNTTLIGMAVNQMGRISATTSVSENGSVILRAQGNARPSDGSGNVIRATESGTLTLGEGSRIEIGVDTTLGADGKPLTSTDTAGFATSHIDLAGHTVVFERDASIVAPGATVNVRAETLPTYDIDAALTAGTDDTARIIMRAGSTIDVSGTTGTVESVARHFVTTELLGSNDLKDAPIQKDGLLYRSRVMIDTREDSPILGNLDNYRSNIARTAEERLSAGGTVRMRAEAGVATEAGSRIDVSGGQVRYTDAQVRETQLMGEDGRTYTLADAPADMRFLRASNLLKSSQATYDRWGLQVAYGSVTPSRTEAGYTEGRSAGTLQIAAPTVALGGRLLAGTVQGDRQQAGLDVRASGGTLHLGAVVNGGKDFDVSTGPDAVLRNFAVGNQGTQFGEGFWEAPTDALLPERSAMSLTDLQSTGFQDVAIAANGATRFGDDAKSTYHMADGGSLRVLSSDDAATLGASVRGAAGSVQIESKRWDVTNPRLGGIVKSQGAATVEDGVTVDLSGNWVNQALGQLPLDHSATTGGSFVAQGYGVTLGQGSVIDVSGGATVSTSGIVTGANAGSIALTDHTLTEDADHNTVQLNGELRGYSAASAGGQASGGGSLAISTHHVRIDNEAQPDATPGLALGSSLFDQGGFQSFDIGGRLSVDVGEDTRIAPNVGTWQAPANAALAANGQSARDVLQSGLAPGLRQASASITLSAGGESADHTAGVLNVGRGAVIEAGDQGSVNLSAAHRLDFEGGIVAHGGNATLVIKGSSEADANVLWVGEQARIDVSGTTVIQPGRTDGQQIGQVLAGGNITLNAGQGYASHLVLHEGARLDARGARGTLDVTELGASGMHTEHRVIDSAGGSVKFASNGALLAEGDVRLQGSGSAAGGSLSVALQSADKVDTDAILDPRALELAAQRTALTPGLDINQLAVPDAIDGHARLGTDWLLAAGAGQLRLASADTLTLTESITLDVNGTLTLAARGLGAAAGTTSHLSAGQVFIGWTGSDVGRSDTSHLPSAPKATAGDAALRIDAAAGLVLDGKLSTQGLRQLTLASGGDMRLQSRDVQLSGRYQAGLKTQADLTLSADQVYAATDTDYLIEATGHLVRVERSDPTEKLPPKPLSAAGGVAIAAADIVQAGVIRSPLGHISLDATNSLTLAQGSETSVSAAGLATLYGTATDDTWTKPGSGLLDTTPDKRIELNAPTLSTKAGSVTDVSGGGALIATEFVPGKGGSKDILAAGSGYALVPGQTALGAADPSLAAGAAAQGRQIVISQAVKLPDGSTLAAGTYTLLPARYAMLPGAFFVRPSTYGAPLADGIAIARNDGSVLLGASTSTAGSSAAASLPQTWQLMSKATALRYSEIREHDLGQTFAARAAHDGVAAPELPNDGGAVVLRAAQARLEGSGRYAAATDSKGQPLGLAGRTEIVADKIQVDAGNVDGGGDGVLHLSAASLNQIGGGSVVLGATSNGIVSGADGSRLVSLEAQSSSVVFAQGTQALTVGDLTAATTGTLQVNDGAVFTPGGTGSGASTGFALRGDGAALRVSAGGGAVLERTKVEGLTGDLQVGSGVRVNAPSGSLILDSSHTARLAPDARLAASQITLAAGAIAVGEAQDGALSLTPELAAQVSSADQLTLRAYEQIGMSSGVTLGQAGLQSLVLDSAHLRVSGDAAQPAQIVASAIRLTNTTGVKADPDTTEAGGSALQLHAVGRTGVIGLGDGSMAFDNVSQLTLRADQAIALAGKFTLVAPGDVALQTPSLVAGQLAGEADLNVAGTLRIDSNGAVATAASLDGGRFGAVAQHIEQAGRIVLPSGEVTLQGRAGVQVAAGSVTDVAGRTVTLDGIAVDQRGGRIAIGADTGDVALQAGARLDVSGAGRSGAGGSLSLGAAQGEIQLGATLAGHSGSDAAGARISVDANQPLDIGRLASDLTGQFSAEVALRQREGALTIDAGQSFKAERIALSADQGTLTVRGTLDASSSSEGGAIALASGNDLVLDAGARLLAQATGKEGNGGRIDLNSVAGRIHVGAGSEMQLRGGSESGESGKLTLRAARENTTDVAIDPLAGLIEGAARIDVQAVRVYDGIVRVSDQGHGGGRLNPEDVNADNAAFIGVFGENAEAIAQRLGGGRTEILDALKVHAEAEVRSNGILRVEPEFDWILGRESESVLNVGGNAAHVGDSSLTLRSAGKLTIGRTIESGYASFGVRSAQGGTIRAIAGADLQAAAPDATATGVEGEHLVVSNRSLKRSQEWVNIRTTTGDIVLAASGDVDLRDRGIVQTAGGPQDADADKAMIALNLNANSFPVFGRNGGDVTINAGHDVLASEAGTGGVTGYASLFSTRTGNDLDASYIGVVTSADLSHGVLSLAGGDIRVNAGRDVVNLVAASAGNAYVVDDGISKVAHAFAGGNAELQAGRDVVNGLVAATGGRLDVQAGRDVVRNRKADGTRVTTPGLRLYYGDTDVRVDGRRDVDIGLVNSRWFSFDADLVSDNWLTGFDNAARLNAVAAAGHLAFNAATTDNDGSWALLPAQTRFAAAHGDIHVGETGIDFVRLVQQPTKDGSLELLAGGSLNSETNVPWQINASRGANAEQADLRSADITAELQIGFGQLTSDARWTDGSQLDQGDRSPVRFVAATGDLGIGDDIVSARPLRLVAGNDLTLYGESKVQLQHQTDTELSLLQAGRDINLTDSLVRAAGPGELVLLAGRDIDLGRADQQAYGSGVVAIGNSENTLLDRRSAAITLVAGLRADGSDYGGAVAQGFHVLGSAVLARHAGDLYALLSAPQSKASRESSAPALGGAEGKAFDALDSAGQLARIKTLMGDKAYDTALAAYVRGLPGNESLDAAAALAAFAKQSPARQDAAPAALLAGMFASQPAADRQSFVLQLAAAEKSRTGAGLQAWMKLRTGQDLSLADAAAQFERLPLERQVSWLNQVLVDELRTSGRAAAGTSGYDAEAAYLRGYAAINTVFAIDRPEGEIRLPSTQVKTLQPGNVELVAATDKQRAVTLGAITLMTPGGGVDAGELGSSAQKANNLGVVTVSGADIAGVVRHDFAVNQSRVFSLAEGDILLWASEGDIDAGRGAKTVTGAPAPVLRLDVSTGKVFLDTSGSFTGSGIAVLDAKSELDLYAPAGAIDAGEAGIRARGNVFLGAQVVRGADNLQVGGSVVGAPVAASTVNPAASLSAAAGALAPPAPTDDEDERRRRRAARRTLLLEFLGFGRG